MTLGNYDMIAVIDAPNDETLGGELKRGGGGEKG